MNKLMALACLLLLPFAAQAKMTVSKEYSFPVQMLEKVEASIQKAGARDAEMKEHPQFVSIDSANEISLWCPPHLPTESGEGCSLTFGIQLQGNAHITISKMASVAGKAAEVTAKLAQVDANKTDEHQHFGTIFTQRDTGASHYYCKPEAVTGGAKSWGCYLSVIEALN